MRKIVSVFFIVLFSGVILIQLNCNNTGEKKTLSKEELIKKGKLLVDIGDCNVCHSPKIMTNMGPVPLGRTPSRGQAGGVLESTAGAGVHPIRRFDLIAAGLCPRRLPRCGRAVVRFFALW